ncbi:MAG TPA: MFS transporter [Stellaceae bacterium]|nr:MFS transporter [Stellaceae bacterium]
MTEPQKNRPLILAAVIAAMFMSSIEGTIVATAMPTIVGELGGFPLLGWVFVAYLLPQAVSVPIYGRLADLHGRKRMFFIGCLTFLAGSVLCGFAWNMPSLIVFRALQGIGAGAIMPIAQTIIADTYPPTERARIQSWLGSVWGISAIAGPALGAVIVQHTSWALIFWANVPLGALALILLGLYLHEHVGEAKHRLDLAGAALMATATGALMVVLLQAAELGWWILPLLALSVAAAILLVLQERRSPEPMLPPVVLKNPVVRVGALGNAAIGALMMGVIAFTPTYVQGVMQRGAFEAALGLVLLSLGWPITGSIAARLIVRIPYRNVSTVGGCVLVGSAALLLAVRPDQGLALLCIACFGLGLGLGLVSLTFLLSAQASVTWNVRGIATSSVLFMRSLGQSLGTAAMGAVLNLGIAHRLSGIADPVETLMDPARRAALAPADLARLSDAVAVSLQAVFVVIVLMAVALLVAARMMPHGTLADPFRHLPVDGTPASGQIKPSR